MRFPSLLAITTTLLLWGTTSCKQAPQPLPSFETGSIDPAIVITPELVRSGRAFVGVNVDKTQARFGGFTLTDLIAYAYRVKSYQVWGPYWMDEARFDVSGKLRPGASPDQVPEMLRGLLAQKFLLNLHQDTSPISVYALTVDPGGAKLTSPPPAGEPNAANTTQAVTMEKYADFLSKALDRPVVDRTGLQGEYMISTDSLLRAVTRLRKRELPAQPSDPVYAETFAAVQSLGLQLNPRKLSMPVIVIDYVKRPDVKKR